MQFLSSKVNMCSRLKEICEEEKNIPANIMTEIY